MKTIINILTNRSYNTNCALKERIIKMIKLTLQEKLELIQTMIRNEELIIFNANNGKLHSHFDQDVKIDACINGPSVQIWLEEI